MGFQGLMMQQRGSAAAAATAAAAYNRGQGQRCCTREALHRRAACYWRFARRGNNASRHNFVSRAWQTARRVILSLVKVHLRPRTGACSSNPVIPWIYSSALQCRLSASPPEPCAVFYDWCCFKNPAVCRCQWLCCVDDHPPQRCRCLW